MASKPESTMNIIVNKLERCPNMGDDLKAIFSESFITDVVLKTKTNTFPAHKVILCARSPVFKLMFSNNMKEKNTASIQLDDLEDETVQKLLLFLYSDKLEDLEWESAIQLYYAADKYQIEKLKLMCSSFLIGQLTTSTVADLLVLADTHSDSDLLKIVEKYIMDHDEQIFCSDEWEKLMEKNNELALKTMHLKYKIKKELLSEEPGESQQEKVGLHSRSKLNFSCPMCNEYFSTLQDVVFHVNNHFKI